MSMIPALLLLFVCIALLGLAAYLAIQISNLNKRVGAVRAELEREEERTRELSAAVSERDARAAELATESRNHQARVRSLEQQLGDFKSANVEFAEEVDQLLRERGHLQGLVEEFTAKAVVVRLHTVFLDGMPHAGKTTLIERLTNPTATPERLDRPDSTLGAYRTMPVPLCWEEKDGVRILHALDFVDIAGSRPEHVGNMIDQHTGGRAVSLVLWDAARGVQDNAEHLSPVRLSATYERQRVREVISGFVVFLNKADLVARQGVNGATEAHVEEVLQSQQQTLLTEVFRKGLLSYPEPQFVTGSARSGAGVHDCLGAIIRGLGLAHLFPKPGPEPGRGGGPGPLEERPSARRP